MTAETRPQASRTPTSTQNNSAALRGASLAFGKPPVKPKPNIDNSYSGNNGALAAATRAGSGISTPASRNTSMNKWEAGEQRLAHQRTGGSDASGYAGDLDRIQQRLSQLDRGGNGFLQPPSPGPDTSHSPSFIAATLAASRSASVTPNHTGRQLLSAAAMKRQSSFTRRSPGRSPSSVRSLSPRGSEDHVLDTNSIPPTTSLIGMFEQNATPQNGKKLPLKISATSATDKPAPSQERPIPARARSPQPLITKSSKPPEIKSPKPSLAPPMLPNPNKLEASKAPPLAGRPFIPTSKPIPIPFKPQPPQAQNEDDDTSSDDSFVSASDYKPSWRATLQNQNRRSTPNSAQPINTVDSLANAIVASSLASSRAASPSRSLQATLYPPPPPPRRSPHRHLFLHKKESRTPSPAKQTVLKTTMRKPKVDEEMDEGEMRRRKKAHLMKKHPNKHHEGDRKRWRDEITERERKRYEAVWASNKGLYTTPGLENCVCNLVVRDIFSRSRLNTDVLEEIYALVDRTQIGGLERAEFVVGLWLIDQRLKGRKLPVKVSDSVWKSVGVLSGIKVRNAKAGR